MHGFVGQTNTDIWGRVFSPRSFATVHLPNQKPFVILGLLLLAKLIAGISIGLVISLRVFWLAKSN